MQYRDSRQEVMGLVVNRKVNVPASYRYTVRAMVDKLFKTGQFEFVVKMFDSTGAPLVTATAGRSKQLMGMLSYIDQVDLFNRKLCEKNGIAPTDTAGRVELFRRFLYFDASYAPAMPVIVCEGETDNTYLKHAIKSLAAIYPALAAAGSPPKVGVRLFKYAERRTSDVTEIAGGVGGLCKLMKHHHAIQASQAASLSPVTRAGSICSHAAIYIGGGMVVDATRGAGVSMQSVWNYCQTRAIQVRRLSDPSCERWSGSALK